MARPKSNNPHPTVPAKPYQCRTCSGTDFYYAKGRIQWGRYCRPCRSKKTVIYDRAKRQKLRIEAIRAYGGSCSCCGESRPQFLSIEHVNRDGMQHRKEIGGASRILSWLKKHDYPKDRFTILCYNCNMSKGFNGFCHVQVA